MTIHLDENFVVQPSDPEPSDPDWTGFPGRDGPTPKPHTHTDRCVDCQLDVIEGHILEMRETLDLIKSTMLRADTTIASIAGEVKPTLDALTSNPAVRMFLGVKKGDKL